jgi:hypothetical protein
MVGQGEQGELKAAEGEQGNLRQMKRGAVRTRRPTTGVARDLFLVPPGRFLGAWLGSVVDAERVSKCLTVRDLICPWGGMSSRDRLVARPASGRARRGIAGR